MAASSDGPSRRAFLTGAGSMCLGMAGMLTLADLIAACGGGSSSGQGGLTSVKVQLLWIEDVEFAGNLAVEKQGFGKEEGVIQTLIPGGPQTNAIQAVAGGSAPIGLIGGSDNLRPDEPGQQAHQDDGRRDRQEDRAPGRSPAHLERDVGRERDLR
jgi:hypothetical protein